MIIDTFEFNKLQLDNKVIGLTSGCYDLLHYYHLIYLEKCRAECDFLIVGVDSDKLIYDFKKKNPVIPEHHRVQMIGALSCVGAAFIMRNLKQFEEAVQYAHKLFKNKKELYGKPIIGAEKVELVIIPDIFEVTSTTEILNKIRK